MKDFISLKIKASDKTILKGQFDIFNFHYDYNSNFLFIDILFQINLTNKLSFSFDNIKITSENLYYGVMNIILKVKFIFNRGSYNG